MKHSVSTRAARSTARMHVHQRSGARYRALDLRLFLSLALLVLIIGWALFGPLRSTPRVPPSATFALFVVTLGVAFSARWLRTRSEIDAVTARNLPELLYTFALGALILLGQERAILLALLVSLVDMIPGAVVAPRSLAGALWRMAASGMVTALAGVAFALSAQAVLHTHITVLHAHLVAALVAALIMLCGASVVRVLEAQPSPHTIIAHLRACATSPAIRFQALMLAIGPLLPLAEVLDDVEAEVAWLLFLVPLCAIYYLALTTLRLEQRSAELQSTVAELSVARQRQADLRDYAALITRAQEEERRRLARELHDDTAQALVALSRGLDALSARRQQGQQVPLASADTRFVDELGDLANRSLESIRRACQDLRPSVLDDLGLPAALASLASSTTQRGLPCELTQTGQARPFAPETEVAVYRIAQEALSNVRRHAQARAATLALDYTPDALRLSVRDDGLGFDYPHVLASTRQASRSPEALSGLGLLGMRERAALIGARLSIESAPGAGTHLTLLVPDARVSAAAPRTVEDVGNR